MELQELYALMDRFSRSSLTELEWEKKDERIALRRAPAPTAQTVAAPSAEVLPAPEVEEGEVVKAPLVGVFYAAPAPGEPPFAAPGTQVKKGETLCLIEAMKMMSEIAAPADCVVDAVLVQDGEAVGFQAPLFRIRRV